MKRRMSGAAGSDTKASGGQAASTPQMDHHYNSGPERSGSRRGGSLRQMGGVGMLQRRADQFDLDEAQLDTLDALRVDFELEKVDLRAAMRKSKIRLRAAMRKDEPDETEVMARIDEVSCCEGELKKMAFHHLQKARAVLTQDQCKKIKIFRRSEQVQKVQKWRQQQGKAA